MSDYIIAYLYDAITLAAVGADRCVKAGDSLRLPTTSLLHHVRSIRRIPGITVGCSVLCCAVPCRAVRCENSELTSIPPSPPTQGDLTIEPGNNDRSIALSSIDMAQNGAGRRDMTVTPVATVSAQSASLRVCGAKGIETRLGGEKRGRGEKPNDVYRDSSSSGILRWCS